MEDNTNNNNNAGSINHLLVTHGILSEFSISKKISSRDMLKLKNRAKKMSKNKKEFDAQMQKNLIAYTQKDVADNSVPGIIIPEGYSAKETPEFFEDDTKMMQLSYLSDVIAKKLINSNYSKEEICYVVLNLLGMLGVSNEDFRKFNKNYEFFDDSMPDDEDENDDGDGDKFEC